MCSSLKGLHDIAPVLGALFRVLTLKIPQIPGYQSPSEEPAIVGEASVRKGNARTDAHAQGCGGSVGLR